VCCGVACVTGHCCTEADCTGGLTCLGNQCVACTQDADCAATEYCNSSGLCEPNVGCSDGTREGFANQTTFRRIAACEGAWTVAGMPAAASCGLASGNSSANPGGTGCAAADLCAGDFHVCQSQAEVLADLPAGQTCVNQTWSANLFFATEQSGPGCDICDVGGVCSWSGCTGCENFGACDNDVFGCGSMGSAVTSATCGVLNEFTDNQCGSLAAAGGWSCNAPAAPDGGYGAGCFEKLTITKSAGKVGGGVLCCAN